MTEFGRRIGDMEKSTYDTDESGVVDDSESTANHASKHQSGGSDEINVAGLAGELADNQPPKSHALAGASHSQSTLAQLNLKVSDATLDDAGSTRDPNTHKASHQSGGSDEVDCSGLVGRADFVDKGDPSGADFSTGSFTTDGNFNELDLSAIVPAGTKAVHITMNLQDDDATASMELRKAGNSNVKNILWTRLNIANQTVVLDGIVACSAARKIEYRAKATTWTLISLVVRSYFV